MKNNENLLAVSYTKNWYLSKLEAKPQNKVYFSLIFTYNYNSKKLKMDSRLKVMTNMSFIIDTYIMIPANWTVTKTLSLWQRHVICNIFISFESKQPIFLAITNDLSLCSRNVAFMVSSMVWLYFTHVCICFLKNVILEIRNLLLLDKLQIIFIFIINI